MSRLVKHDANGPKEVDGVWCCMCGLSNNKPLCDGSHKKTHDEQHGKVYVYDKDKRVEI